jgi:hypothetical protein
MVWNFNENGKVLDEGDGLSMQDAAADEWWHGYDIYDQLWAGKAIGFGDEDYERLKEWDRMGGVMKIEPIKRKQNYYRAEVAYIAQKLPYPQIQRVPISGVKITPHQISFDFFDTTEGKIGVSNATEKHMVVECDILVTEMIYFMWNHAGTENQGSFYGLDGTGGGGGMSGMRYFKQLEENVNKLIEAYSKGECPVGTEFNKNGEGWWNFMWSTLNVPWNGYNRVVQDFQQTQAFIDFRNSFLQQFNGWVCQFTSEVFGVFNGVITEISYEIEDGSMDAKWHLKIQEAIFTDDYSEEGKKQTETSEGSEDGSG